jgi:hypothetical protein
MDPRALQIQRLGSLNHQALVMLQVCSLSSPDQASSAADVTQRFLDVHLPPPQNVSQHLTYLRQQRLAMQPAAGRWAVSPEGEEEIRRLMGEIDSKDLERLGQEAGEPEFAGAPHHRIPPSMAPAIFQKGISEFLRDHPRERNVFLMVRYPREEDSYSMQPTIQVSRDLLVELGMEAHLASDRAVDDQLFPNVGIYLWACDFGVAILEEREKRLNYNVVLEAGAMLMTGRRCLLLKDKSVEGVPTDLGAHIRKDVDLDKPETVTTAIREWVAVDLRLG